MEAGDPAHRHPRTDVYALGVTLFELLALRRPRPGELSGAPAGVPRELLRVVKAATTGGYATAGEMATDLDRYLTGRAVRAGRPGWVRNATRWAARHRAVLGAAAAAFAVAAAAGGGLLARAYDRERTLRLAGERREEQLAAAVEVYSPAVDDLLYATPGMLDRQRTLLERARAVHRELVAARPTDPRAAARLAQVEWRLGRVLARQGQRAEGAAALERSIDLFRAVAAADPGEPLHRLDLARSHAVLSTTRDPADPGAAVADFEAAVGVVRGLVADDPADVRFRDALASYLGDYGAALAAARRPAEADAALREALATAEASRAAATHWHGANPVLHAQRNLAAHAWATCLPDDALRHGDAALATCRFLLDRAEESTEASRALDLRTYREVEVGLAHDRVVWLLALGRDAGPAASDYERVGKRFKDHYPDHPHDHTVTLSLYRGWATARAGRTTDLRLRRYAAHLDRRQAANPTSAAAKAAVARFAAVCPADGVCDLERAVALAREAVAADPRPCHQFALGAVLARRGAAEAAEAGAVLARVPDDHPDRRTADLFLAVAAAEAGNAAEAQAWRTRADSRRLPPDPVEPDLLYRLATRGVPTAAR